MYLKKVYLKSIWIPSFPGGGGDLINHKILAPNSSQIQYPELAWSERIRCGVQYIILWASLVGDR